MQAVIKFVSFSIFRNYVTMITHTILLFMNIFTDFETIFFPVYKWKLLTDHQKLFFSPSILVDYMARECTSQPLLQLGVVTQLHSCQLNASGKDTLNFPVLAFTYRLRASARIFSLSANKPGPGCKNANEDHTLGAGGTERWRRLRPWLISGTENGPTRTFNMEICISQLLA